MVLLFVAFSTFVIMPLLSRNDDDDNKSCRVQKRGESKIRGISPQLQFHFSEKMCKDLSQIQRILHKDIQGLNYKKLSYNLEASDSFFVSYSSFT